MVSQSSSRAPDAFPPPLVSGADLLDIISKRREKGVAFEFPGLPAPTAEEKLDEKKRIQSGKGHDFMWLRQMRVQEGDLWRYAILLFEYVDQSRRGFAVVDTEELTGREISGDENERGGVSSHVVVRLPIKQYDDASYRCAIETAPHITRSEIEKFLSRQLRRQATAGEWSYNITVQGKKKPEEKVYRYNPKLLLYADIGQKIDFTISGGRELAQMIFTKYHEKRSIGKATSITTPQDIVADVELKVSAKQGPDDPKERYAWLSGVRAHFETNGYKSRMVYRNIGGGTLSGSVHRALAGATDLVMCQKELISFDAEPKDWYGRINTKVTDQLIELLDKDSLWERSQ